MTAPSLSFTRWTVVPLATLVWATGCGGIGSSKPEIVDMPANGVYAGSVQIEKRSYAAGIRVDTRTCSAPVLIEVDTSGASWFRMLEATCDLGGLEGQTSLRLVPASGSTATGSPMGMLEGSVPDMTWIGSFWSDGEFEADASTTVDGFGTRAEWDVTLTAMSTEGAFDSGIDSGL
jgi:hypothetical protein